LRLAGKSKAQIRFFNGEFISRLPLYDPNRSTRTEAECEFIDAIRQCHGIIVGTPGYHGVISGPIKNALDLLEDTASDSAPYLDGRAFGCIVTAYGWQACGTALLSLRMIAHALRAWPTPFGATLNASVPLFDGNGLCLDPKVSGQLRTVTQQVVQFARWRHADEVLERPKPDACAPQELAAAEI
jgi:FMN reductase